MKPTSLHIVFFFMSNDKLLLSFYRIPTSWNHLPKKKNATCAYNFSDSSRSSWSVIFPPKDDGKSVGICILKDESEGKNKVYGRTAAQKTTLFVDAMAGMA